jgi:hypothetical protein
MGAVYWWIARQASIKNEFGEVVSSPDLETEFHSRKAISNNSAVNLDFFVKIDTEMTVSFWIGVQLAQLFSIKKTCVGRRSAMVAREIQDSMVRDPSEKKLESAWYPVCHITYQKAAVKPLASDMGI